MIDRLEFLDISHHQGQALSGGGHIATIDMAAVKASGLGPLIIIRTNYGMREDDLAAEHIRRADAAGIPRTHYWYNLSRQDPKAMADKAFTISGSLRGRRMAMDVEENASSDGLDPQYPRRSVLYFNHVTAGLKAMDAFTGQVTHIYSSKSYMDEWFTKEQQDVWADEGRFGWWAQYPNETNPQPPAAGKSPLIPAGWQDNQLVSGKFPWGWWQYTGNGTCPGVQTKVDINVTAPGVTAAMILGTTIAPVPPEPPEDDMQLIVDLQRHMNAAFDDALLNGRVLEYGEAAPAPLLWWQQLPENVPLPKGRYQLKNPNANIQFFHQDGTAFVPPLIKKITWAMDVTFRKDNMLLVNDVAGTVNDWWVKAQDVEPV